MLTCSLADSTEPELRHEPVMIGTKLTKVQEGGARTLGWRQSFWAETDLLVMQNGYWSHGHRCSYICICTYICIYIHINIYIYIYIHTHISIYNRWRVGPWPRPHWTLWPFTWRPWIDAAKPTMFHGWRVDVWIDYIIIFDVNSWCYIIVIVDVC